LNFDVSMQTNVSDQWVWLPDPSGGYFVQGVYSMLTMKDVTLAGSFSSGLSLASIGTSEGLSFCMEAVA